MDFNEWIAIGIKENFCGPPVCSTHDGIPSSHEEDELWEKEDPCIHIIRPYIDLEHKQAIESNHSPSTWRDIWTHIK